MYYLHPRPLPDEISTKSVTFVSRCACRSCFGTSATTCRRRPETTRSPDSGSTWSGRWRTTSSPTTCPAASSSWSAGRRSSSRRMTSRWAGFESRRRWHFDHFNDIMCASRKNKNTRDCTCPFICSFLDTSWRLCYFRQVLNLYEPLRLYKSAGNRLKKEHIWNWTKVKTPYTGQNNGRVLPTQVSK